MARMIFKNAYNYDSATRQLDTGDLDHILDVETDMGYAFSLVVDAAIDANLVDFVANFINDNDLLTQADADTLYELIGAVAAHVAAVNPHPIYLTQAEADLLYTAIGAASTLNELTDVTITTPANGALLSYDSGSGQWIDAPPAATTLDALSDVVITTPANGNLLTYDSGSGQWIDAPPASQSYTSTTITVTTASLAVNAVETGTVALPEGARLKKINPDRACRVRLYLTAAHRTADASRAIGAPVNIATDHGLLFEYVATATIDAYLTPSVDVFQGDGETAIYYSIENRSAGTSTVAVIFDYLRTE
jgi:hypothetical protein